MKVELPGLFDLQVNGFGGVDFNAPDLTADRVGRSARADARDRRDPLPADAHHVVVRSVRRERARAVARIAIRRSPASTWRVRTSRPRTARAARIRASTSRAGQRRRFPPAPGRRRRPHRARHAGAGSARRAAAHRTSGRARACASRIGHTAATPRADRRCGRRRRDAGDASRQRVCADAAAASERDLGAAGGRRAVRQRDRRMVTTCRRRRSKRWCARRAPAGRFS